MTITPPMQAPTFEDEANLLQILNVLLKRWRTVTVLPAIVALIVLGVSFLVSPTYTAVTSFVPEVNSQGRMPAGLAGLASQFGIPLGTDASQSPFFYADVATSRPILDRLLLSRYADPRAARESEDSTTLLNILRTGGRSPADSLERGARKLGGLLSVGVDAQTNIVTVRMRSRYPDLAAGVANSLVSYINDFNAQTRQSQARERRKFTEQRVAAAERDLSEAEESLKRFYQANRTWQQSPQLVFEEGQLRRQMELRQELNLTLRREYEIARIEEVNDTPMITVVEAAIVPQRKSSPKRRLWAGLAFVLSSALAVPWAFSAEYLERAKRNQDAVYRDVASNAQKLRRAFLRAVRSVLPGFVNSRG